MPKSIFIVEDEKDLMEFYIDLLKLYGHAVVGTAENGAEAVEKYARLRQRPDVIIMDYRIPIKNGIEAAREILEIDPDAKIIFASADRSVESEAREMGIVAFMKKPFDVERLLSNIEKI